MHNLVLPNPPRGACMYTVSFNLALVNALVTSICFKNQSPIAATDRNNFVVSILAVGANVSL